MKMIDMLDYFDFFNQRIGVMLQKQAETFAAVTAPPCKNFSSTPLDSATIDGSYFDTSTSTNVQGGVVPANIYSCNHWIINSTAADYFNTSRGGAWRPSPPAQVGDIMAMIVWEIPYTRCNSSTTTKTYMKQYKIFNKQSDGSFTENNTTASAYQPTLIGTLDSYYSAGTMNAANNALQPNGWAIRITTSQLNTMINALINGMNTFMGSSPTVKSGYNDCFMLLSQPARWVNAPNSVVWTTSEAELATAGGGRPLKVSIAWENYAVPSQPPTEGRYVARTNGSGSQGVVVGRTTSITPNTRGYFNKSNLASELEALKTVARNYVAGEDQQEQKELDDFNEQNRCDDGWVRTGQCGANASKQWRGKCYRCVCREGYVSDNYDNLQEIYISNGSDSCQEMSCPDNSIYNANLDKCVCKSGFTENSSGECIENDYSLDPNEDGDADEGDTDSDNDLFDDGDGDGDDEEEFDIEAHLKEYGVWYGFGLAGVLAMSLLSPKRG